MTNAMLWNNLNIQQSQLGVLDMSSLMSTRLQIPYICLVWILLSVQAWATRTLQSKRTRCCSALSS